MTREVLVAERLACVIVIILSAYCMVETLGFPQLRADPGGGALFPRIAAGLAILGSLIVLFRGLPASRHDEPVESNTDFVLRLRRSSTTPTIIFSIAYPWLIMKAGFLVATTIYVFLLMRIMQVPLRAAAPYAIAVSGVLYFVFVFVLEAYVPVGDWMHWVVN